MPDTDKDFVLDFLKNMDRHHLVFDLIKQQQTQINLYTNKNTGNFVCVFSNPDIILFDRTAEIIDLEYYSWAERNFYISHKNVYSIFRFKKIFFTKNSFSDIDYTNLFQNNQFIKSLRRKHQATGIPPSLQNYFLL